MNITSLENLIFNTKDNTYNLYYPLIKGINIDLFTYIVQRGEDMRLDLVMMSIYGDDDSVLNDMDIILYINNIDNPLNISEGDIIYYPLIEKLSVYRYAYEIPSNSSGSVREMLATPNKTTKKDSSRKSFIENGYMLPPVVMSESKEPITLQNGKIVIGGLN